MSCSEINKTKEKPILQKKIKRKYWQTKGIVESSEVFRLTL